MNNDTSFCRQGGGGGVDPPPSKYIYMAHLNNSFLELLSWARGKRMERDEYIKELRKLYELALGIGDVCGAFELLKHIREEGQSVTVPESTVGLRVNLGE